MLYRRGSLQWIETGGGPLILLPRDRLHAWSGADVTTQQSENVAGSGSTDYERACAVDNFLGLVKVADTQALVLGEEPMSTAWHPTGPVGGLLIRWVYGDDISAVPTYLTNLDDAIWTPSGISVTMTNQPHYLLDSAWPGAEAAVWLEITLNEGRYTIDTRIAHPANRTELLLHRLRLI